MKKKTRLILLTIIGALILLLVALGLSYAYMHNSVGAGSHTKIGANSCAKILLMEKSNSINLTNSYPMSENAALNTDPYSFGIRSTCSGNRGFKLYIVTLAGNTISANNIRFALTPKGEKEIITTGIVGQLSSGSSDYNATQTTQLQNSVGTIDSIYYTYEDNITLGEATYYDLYMWVDGDATTSVANKSFTAAVAILEGEYDNSDIKVRLAGNINTYDANVSCTGTNNTKWNPLNRSVEVFDISQKPTNCTVTAKTNTNLGNLKSIVESANDVYEEEGASNFTAIAQNKYNMPTPFYTTSWSTTVTSGTDEAAAISWDSTNNYWVTNPSVASSHYYFLITVADAGYYQMCYKQLSGGTSNRLYRYKNTTNMYTSTYLTASSTTDVCLDYGYVQTTDTIRIDQYTYSAVASLALYLKKGETISAGYRYEGEDPNNYVWFNNELWRIIGSIPTKIDSGGSTTSTNLVKIIRTIPLGAYAYNNSNTIENNTPFLYTLLNNYYYGSLDGSNHASCYSYVNTNTSCDFRYIGIKPDDYYGAMVKEVYWNTGITSNYFLPSTVFGDELSVQTLKGNVGIIYLSDYGFATSYNRPTRTILYSYQNTDYMGNDWLYMFESNTYTFCGMYYNCYISKGGNGGYQTFGNASVIIPVVYLEPTVYVVSGYGTQGNPYKLGI